jgi:predicted AAA+ superfamily ATPase
MHTYIPRQLEGDLLNSINRNPVTALIGPRQCGKSTLARRVLTGRPDALFLDLELPSDLRRLADPEFFFNENADKLICIDEIQVKPDLFPLIRTLVDRDRRAGRFLLLGSASRDTIRRSGETLAGRIHYLELTPFVWGELRSGEKSTKDGFRKLWWRGGFPPAYLAATEGQSVAWRRDLIQDYLYRDIPRMGFSISASALLRFWTMVSHYHGGLFNASKIGQSLDVSHNTVRKYLDIMEQSFMARVLRPVEVNLKKRLVKSPKVYVRDSGILHSLLEIGTMSDLYGHPVFGASWEGWCIEQILSAMPLWRPGFYRTPSGEELDLILELGQKRLAFEIKASLSPHLSRGFPGTLDALKPERVWIVCPMEEKGYANGPRARVVGIGECLDELRAYKG